jgi:hypothetical protein
MSQPKRAGRLPKSRNLQPSADTADGRWTIRGVPGNIRTRANKKAKALGMTVGDWVTEAIVQYSKSDRNRIKADSESTSAVATLADSPIDIEEMMEKRLTDMETRIMDKVQQAISQTGQTKKKKDKRKDGLDSIDMDSMWTKKMKSKKSKKKGKK